MSDPARSTQRFAAPRWLPESVRSRLTGLRRDLHVVLEGLAGRHPPPLVPRTQVRTTRAASLAPRSLRIREVIRETADALTLLLEDPSGAPIAFVPGQFFTLLVEVEGQALRRAYSACSSALEPGTVALTCKRVDQGKVSTWLHSNARPGLLLNVLGPSGSFTVAPSPEAARQLVLLGGGSGITPLMAILRAVLAVEPRSRVALIYGNRSSADIIFDQQLGALQEAHRDRFQLRHVLQSPPAGFTGRVGLLDEANLRAELDALQLEEGRETEYFLCGPSGMRAAARAVLTSRRVPAERIHEERFGSPRLPLLPDDERALTRAPQAVEARARGRLHSFTVRPGETLLEAGLRAKVPMPFSCTMGGCGACKVKLYSGAVVMSEPNCLDESERAAGYALACISCPESPLTIEVP
ncbi:MAG: ferredoxin--NADP reductase [Polyangia bacterium]